MPPNPRRFILTLAFLPVLPAHATLPALARRGIVFIKFSQAAGMLGAR